MNTILDDSLTALIRTLEMKNLPYTDKVGSVQTIIAYMILTGII